MGRKDVAARWIERLWPGVAREVARRRRLGRWRPTARRADAGEQRVWGYADRHSVAPGETFRVRLAAAPGRPAVRGRLELARVGRLAGGGFGRTVLWTSAPLEVPPYAERRAGSPSGELDGSAAALGACFEAAVDVPTPSDVASGYLSLDLVDERGRRDEDVAYVVARPARPDVDVLVKLGTATWQAYNRFGGHSLYDERDEPRGRMVSFDRPTPSRFWEWDRWYVAWLEELAAREGLSVGYASGFDLARDARRTLAPRLLVSVGHDEYWTREEFDAAWTRVFEAGGSLLVLGANAAYWQVRYADVDAPPGAEPRGRQLVCHKSVGDPVADRVDDAAAHVTARFRDGARCPETMLLGVGYQSNLASPEQREPRFGYAVVDDALPIFAGTGLARGDRIEGIVGHEWDCRDPEADGPAPGEALVAGATRLWRAGASRIPALDAERVRVALAGEPVDLFGRPGRAEAVLWESPAGARVFAAGTIRWSWGLGKPGYADDRFRRLNENLVLQALAAAPSGAGGRAAAQAAPGPEPVP